MKTKFPSVSGRITKLNHFSIHQISTNYQTWICARRDPAATSDALTSPVMLEWGKLDSIKQLNVVTDELNFDEFFRLFVPL